MHDPPGAAQRIFPLRRLDRPYVRHFGGANVLKVRGPAIARMLKGEDPGEVGFTIEQAVKDLRTMLAEGAARDIALPAVAQTLASFEEGARRGLGAAEAAGLAVYWSVRRAKV